MVFVFQLLNFLCALATIGACHSSVLSNSKCELPKSDAARPHSVTITEFGAVGDGVTLNTKAFHNAMFYLHSFADKGGAQLFVPAGRWLTGSFGLISHLTLFLDKDAVIIGSTVSFRASYSNLQPCVSFPHIIYIYWHITPAKTSDLLVPSLG